ncbi:16S rRNA (uracil(1498)-N(3))-methyltransferase [Aquicoccus sp. SCR17]|nr:16S rRNA (uracil(1498)-N(3))-methyltransferase [Carideicomes alvinocaridis]
MANLVRLYVDHPLGAGQPIPLAREQAHYLFGVMRLSVGAEVLLFNGRDGEWRVTVAEAGKRSGVLEPQERTAPQDGPPDLWLLFAPVKKARTDFIVEKAVELGARRIQPVQTEFTNSERVRRDRLQAHAVEAAEQCGATFVPEVGELEKLPRLLDQWNDTRRLMFCDEGLAGAAADLGDFLDSGSGSGGAEAGPWAILIGPEGGFSDAERQRLHGMEAARAVSLGPRILRADTAAVAALTLWQATRGDWR